MNDAPPSDTELLRAYLQGSEAAFRELVERRIGLVHATARRILAIAPHLADDVTQAVFNDLAGKAASLPKEAVVAGWLYRHSYYLALNAARAERRRRHANERSAMESQVLREESSPENRWAQLAPMLDDALNRLEATDRDAIVMRFLQKQDYRSIGSAMGQSGDAARKRVERALEKLRRVLAAGGLAASSLELLTSTLEAGPAGAAPEGLATSVSTGALMHAAASAGWLSTLSSMITSKYGVGLATALAGLGVGVAVVTHHPSSAATQSAPSAPPAEVAPARAPAPTPAPVQASPIAAQPAAAAASLSTPPHSIRVVRQNGDSMFLTTTADEATITTTVHGLPVTRTLSLPIPRSAVDDWIPINRKPVSSSPVVTNADGSMTRTDQWPDGSITTMTIGAGGFRMPLASE